LWLKIGFGALSLSYSYIRWKKWRELELTGFDIIPPEWGQLGTTWQYTINDGQIQFAEKELLGKNRKSVSFYRLFSPVIATVDESLIKVRIFFLLTKHWTLIKSIFVTHFNAFPTRMPFDSSLGAGKELSTSLDQVIWYKIWYAKKSFKVCCQPL